MRTTHITQDT